MPANPFAVECAVRMLQWLMVDVRHDSSVYDISVEATPYRDVFSLRVMCPALSPGTSSKVLEAIDGCIHRAVSDKRLFGFIRRSLLAGESMSDQSGRDIHDEALAKLDVLGRIMSATEERELLESLTMTDVQLVLERFQEKNRWTFIGKP